MRMIRIIPATMITAALFTVVKIADVTHGTEAIAEQAGESAPAAPTPTPTPAAAAADTAATPAAAAATDAAKTTAAAPAAASADKKPDAAPAAADAAKTGEAAKPEAKKEEAKKESKADKDKNPAVSDEPGALTDRHFSAVELDLLQNLAKRREDLDRWERNIQIKEAALDATEKRIDGKIQQIEAMRQEVSSLLAQYNEKEDAKIRSLVKIYEDMKPDDAARIFNEMDMPVVLLIVDRMSEKKSAPVLAKMDSRKAKQITVDLAEKHKFTTSKVNTAVAAPAAPVPPKTSQQ
jgi:flagellar motility protein MotE (MotC chaperone)